MSDFRSRIVKARAITERLIGRNKDVTIAERKRDICLYKYLAVLPKVEKELRKVSPAEARKMFKADGIKPPIKSSLAMFAIKLTYPGVSPKTCWRYAALRRLIRKEKRPGESIRKFARARGGTSRCVEKKKQRRDASNREHGLGKRKARR